MSKRIHELAKDWGVAAKDLVAAAEKVGIRGKRSQSSLTEEEVRAVRQALGLEPRPAVPLGTERVIAERLVTERDATAEQLVTAREQTTETRLRSNIIRRRTAREVVKREDIPPPSVGGEAASEVPPALDLGAEVPPPLTEAPPPASPEVEPAPEGATERAEGTAEPAAPA